MLLFYIVSLILFVVCAMIIFGVTIFNNRTCEVGKCTLPETKIDELPLSKYFTYEKVFAVQPYGYRSEYDPWNNFGITFTKNLRRGVFFTIRNEDLHLGESIRLEAPIRGIFFSEDKYSRSIYCCMSLSNIVLVYVKTDTCWYKHSCISINPGTQDIKFYEHEQHVYLMIPSNHNQLHIYYKAFDDIWSPFVLYKQIFLGNMNTAFDISQDNGSLVYIDNLQSRLIMNTSSFPWENTDFHNTVMNTTTGNLNALHVSRDGKMAAVIESNSINNSSVILLTNENNIWSINNYVTKQYSNHITGINFQVNSLFNRFAFNSVDKDGNVAVLIYRIKNNAIVTKTVNNPQDIQDNNSSVFSMGNKLLLQRPGTIVMYK